MIPIILASSSPYRQQLLAKFGLTFSCHSPEIDESALPDETPQLLVERLAKAKAQAVASHYKEGLIIGSDQVAVLDGEILTKPHTHLRATEQLQASSGRQVLFLTGLCLYNAATGHAQVETIPFSVHFRSLNSTQIENYLQREQPYDCAGSFKSEGLGISLFERLIGDDPNALVGLPLIRLCAMLANEGVEVL